MSLQTRLTDFITAVGTDYKNLRTWLFGSSSGTLANLQTTDKTSIVNAINEARTTGGAGSPPSASESVAGVVELATQTEVTTGTDDQRAVTPLKLAARLSGISAQPDATDAVKGIVELATNAEGVTGTDVVRAMTPAAVAAVFTDRIDTNVALGGSNIKVPSQAAVKAYADALIGAADAMTFKGVLDASANPNYPAANAGDTYRISVAGKVGGASGPTVEVGDVVMALADGLAAGTHAAVGASWNIQQANIDGAVVGPVSSVASRIAIFSGTTGKVIADSGAALSTDGTLAGASNAQVPTALAVKTYADTKQPLDSDLTAIAALTTTAYGRAFLALADQAALMGLLAAASETVAGKIEIATQAEVTTGTDDVRAVTPLKLATSDTTKFGNPETDLVALYTAAKV